MEYVITEIVRVIHSTTKGSNSAGEVYYNAFWTEVLRFGQVYELAELKELSLNGLLLRFLHFVNENSSFRLVKELLFTEQLKE